MKSRQAKLLGAGKWKDNCNHMKTEHRIVLPRTWLAAVFALFCGLRMSAQISTVVFEDDFTSNAIDPARYQPDAPFFEGGIGDIKAQAGGGVIEFVGTTTKQWWSGATLRVNQTFNASESSPVSLSIDRVAEAGVGSASRSALWILDETKTRYVLFADVRAEGGWRFNRKIGENGDVPTGSGTDIAPFNGGSFDNGLLHRMGIVADGKTVKLTLNGVVGAEVKFPFNKVIFQFGSYARANNDTASTKWDNLKIEVTKPTSVVFSDDFTDGINAAKFQPDAPFFEGGKGDIHAEAQNGMVEFIGTTAQQWWSGATLRVVPSFNATEETPVKLTIDRVAEAGVGTASRSALWILDEAKSKYVLFADVRGEGGWRYNRKIGENGDVPTGSGTDIASFNGGSFDNGGNKKMSLIANGKTVKLLLDGVVGAEVKFPVSKVTFHFGSYARANNDTASTKWDNIKIETIVRQSSIVFQDDFKSNTLDPAQYQADSPFFEGGKGDIKGVAQNGTVEFTGTTTQQWWSGATLRVVPKFEASEESTLTVSIDRVRESGKGSASRSALWIMDETMTRYVLFADVRGEGGWRFNRKIGEDGDVPTGGGTDIAAFNGVTFDDGGLHRMSLIADGKTVKLLLDGNQGAEVKFPFSPVVIQFGSYARANNDTAGTVWDNIKIESAGGAGFSPRSASARVGTTSPPITVKIPAGLNATAPVNVRIVSADPAIAVPDGGTEGRLNLTFAAGAPNTQSFRVRGVSLGGTQFGVEGDVASTTSLSVAIISGPGVQLEDSFAGALDTAKWRVNNAGFEVGTGTYTVAASDGALRIEGSGESDFWSGASVKSVKSFQATPDLNLMVTVDRNEIASTGTAGRTGVFLTTADRSKFVFFGQNFGETGWSVNVNPGSRTGGGVSIGAFDAFDAEVGKFAVKMVADGSSVEVFLNNVSGGRFPFEVSSGIHVEIGTYARATGDAITATFDNARVENVLPCITSSPASVSQTLADSGKSINLTIPQLLNDAATVTVTVTSRNPEVAVPAGAVNGVLTLQFAAGGPNARSIAIQPAGLGSTVFEIASTPSVCVSGSVSVEVVAVPRVLLADDFSGNSVNAAYWIKDETAFESGTATPESEISIENGQVKFNVIAESSLWPGLALNTANKYSASATEPATFEVDRNLLEFDLVTGTSAEQRSGVWVREPGGNFILFGEHVAHDGRNFGWGYNKQTGAADDNPTGNAANIAAFDGGTFDNQKKHRIKVVANGTTVKLFLDGVFGAEIRFAHTSNLTFGIGAYADETRNVTRAFFDNALITGGSVPSVGRFTDFTASGGNVTIRWAGSGTLQSTDSLSPAKWTDVTPAPAGGTFTLPAAQANSKFFRLRQ